MDTAIREFPKLCKAYFLGIWELDTSTINPTVHTWDAVPGKLIPMWKIFLSLTKTRQPGSPFPINAPGLVLLHWGKAELGTRPKEHFCTISALFIFSPGLNYTVWLSPERRFIIPMALKASSFSGSRLQLSDGLIEAKKT